jgi:hypothetical protein
MQYFKSLPKVKYTDKNGVSTIYTNIMARASVMENLIDNAILFYNYDIQDGDTPEIVAYKYYGDINRFWIVMYCNEVNDPLWDWPLTGNKFEEYIDKKYGADKNDIHHYEKTVVSLNRTSGTDFDIKTTTETHEIQVEEYNTLVNLPTEQTFTFNTGIVTLNTTVDVVTNYEYEMRLNEDKRNIKILNKDLAAQLEEEFLKLMK